MVDIDRKSKIILINMSLNNNKAIIGAQKGLWYAGKQLQKEVKAKIKDKTGKSGKYYKYKGRQIQASAPGEYPANRSGNLRKSIGFEVKGQNLEFGARTNAKYAKYLELGTRRMGKRPFLNRTVQKNKLEVANIVGREIEKELTRL